MKPFGVSGSCADLKNTRLSARTIRAAARGGKDTRITLAQLWITEGIPVAFAECPAVYDSIRIWLGRELEVHAKQIGLTGSGRLGESLDPQKFGQPFDENSDLDFYVVSAKLFSTYRCEFLAWCDDYASGNIMPRNDREKNFWEDNKHRVPRNLKCGFIDVRKIPAHDRYGMAQQTVNLMYRLIRKLYATPCSPSPRRASIRCYENWSSLIDRVSINLLWIGQNPDL